MTTCIIELNDHELRVSRNGEIVTRSPGCAVVGNDVQIGQSACQQAHLHPREFHNRFWYRLNETALRRPSRSVRHHADLAYAHLAHLNSAIDGMDSVIFAIPGGYTKEQLALLLGIAEACKIKVNALVDAAVATAAACAGPGDYRHAEIELHRAVITHLSIDDSVIRTHVDVVDGAGSENLHTKFVAFAADQFLAQCRFDPLHHATTEQVLYNEMPRWLELLNTHRAIKVHVDYRESRFEARLARDEMIAVVQPTYNEIVDRLDSDQTSLIGSRLGAMPGFMRTRSNQYAMSESAIFDGCTVLTKDSELTRQLSLLTRLVACEKPSVQPQEKSTAEHLPQTSAKVATHILSGAHAYELSLSPLFLTTHGGVEKTQNGRSIARLMRDGMTIKLTAENKAQLRVNGLPLDTDTTVMAGDEITADGSTIIYKPIEVVPRDAP